MIGKAIGWTAAGGAAYLGAGEVGQFASDPRDYIRSRFMPAWDASMEYGPTLGAITGGVLAGAGALTYGAVKYPTQTANLGKSVGKGLAKGAANFTTSVGQGAYHMGRRAMSMTDKVRGGIVEGTGKAWDRYGAMSTMGGYAKMGFLYGGLTTGLSLSVNRYISDEAMARSQEGGIYDGNEAFGQRSGSTLRALGDSAMGLTQGLHNRR